MDTNPQDAHAEANRRLLQALTGPQLAEMGFDPELDDPEELDDIDALDLVGLIEEDILEAVALIWQYVPEDKRGPMREELIHRLSIHNFNNTRE